MSDQSADQQPTPAEGETSAPQAPPRAEGGRRISPLKWLAFAFFGIALIAALVPVFGLAGPSEEDIAGQATTTSRTAETPEKTSAKAPTTTKTIKKTTSKKAEKATETTAGEIDAIDPDATEQANSERNRRKLVVGGIAAGLLVVVLWGRKIRSSRRKQSANQAKGK